MVDHQVDGNLRVDPFRCATKLGDSITHGGKVDNSGDAGEVLHQYAGRAVGDLAGGRARLQPIFDGGDVGLCHGTTVFKAQQIF